MRMGQQLLLRRITKVEVEAQTPQHASQAATNRIAAASHYLINEVDEGGN